MVIWKECFVYEDANIKCYYYIIPKYSKKLTKCRSYANFIHWWSTYCNFTVWLLKNLLCKSSMNKTKNQGNLLGESVLVTILSLPMEIGYCISWVFIVYPAKQFCAVYLSRVDSHHIHIRFLRHKTCSYDHLRWPHPMIAPKPEVQ